MNPAVAQKDSAVISYLHYFFEYYGLGKCEVDLHCDNCSGQNKNNFVLAYLMWRTFYGLHHRVPLHFLIAEHTKFAPDCCFGLLKKAFRLTPVSSLQELGTRIQSSTQKSVNIAQIVGPENGPSIVPVYDWQSFLSPLFKVVRHTRTTIISPFYHASQALSCSRSSGTVERSPSLCSRLESCMRMGTSVAPQYYRGNGDALNMEHRGVCRYGDRLHSSTVEVVLLFVVTPR